MNIISILPTCAERKEVHVAEVVRLHQEVKFHKSERLLLKRLLRSEGSSNQDFEEAHEKLAKAIDDTNEHLKSTVVQVV
ncbi:hypothetical protein ACH5RR_009106 [Cinchona calisaya]|uniref:Uncharacterized protein n=1 Tax=Cinchona calisaya TaxID=153742 RepID=A0ABD3ADG1_9GENT